MGRPPKDQFERTYMTEAQIRENEQDIRSLERMLEEDKHRSSPKIQDPYLIEKEIREKRELLKRHAPQKLKGNRANEAYAEAKRLEKRIQESLLRGKDYKQPYPTSKSSSHADRDFERAVQHEMKFMTDRELKRDITKYKAIMRNLDPDDPTLANIERLRK